MVSDEEKAVELTRRLDDWRKRFIEYTHNGDKDYIRYLSTLNSVKTSLDMRHFFEEYEELILEAERLTRKYPDMAVFYRAALVNCGKTGDAITRFSERLR